MDFERRKGFPGGNSRARSHGTRDRRQSAGLAGLFASGSVCDDPDLFPAKLCQLWPHDISGRRPQRQGNATPGSAVWALVCHSLRAGRCAHDYKRASFRQDSRAAWPCGPRLRSERCRFDCQRAYPGEKFLGLLRLPLLRGPRTLLRARAILGYSRGNHVPPRPRCCHGPGERHRQSRRLPRPIYRGRTEEECRWGGDSLQRARRSFARGRGSLLSLAQDQVAGHPVSSGPGWQRGNKRVVWPKMDDIPTQAKTVPLQTLASEHQLEPLPSTTPRMANQEITGPSSLYSAGLWRLGVFISRHMPHFLLGRLTVHLAQAYWLCSPARRRIVYQNVLPALNGDQKAARVTTRELFAQFALKLADLWRYESGLSIYNLFRDLTGWEHFQAAQAQKRGVLLVTIHLGNWEFGAPLLTQRGIRLQVITGPEPQARLTEIRQAARARWGIETLPIGDNPFAAVEIIRRLEANNAVALLMDRPPAATAVPVELFGKTFHASISAAELARASGCV